MDTIRPHKIDKAQVTEEVTNIEKYLLKKNRKFLNIVYLSFKFPALCELYFKMPGEPQSEYPDDLIVEKRKALSAALTEAMHDIEELRVEGQGSLLCNYFNPTARLIFRINTNLRRVRIFLRQEFSEIVSIIVSEAAVPLEGYAKFNSAKELKDFYFEFYSYSRKCKTSDIYSKGVVSNPSLPPSEPAPKPSRKVEDDEYEEEEESDNDEENEGKSYVTQRKPGKTTKWH